MGARNSFGHLMPTSRASSGPWDIPRKASIWGSIAFAHKPRGGPGEGQAVVSVPRNVLSGSTDAPQYPGLSPHPTRGCVRAWP